VGSVAASSPRSQGDTGDVTETDHRQLAVDLFNHTWTLIDKTARTPREDDEMLHAAHASAYHWSRVGTPQNLARSEWQVSRVNAVLGRGEAAVHHAQRCLDHCLENGIGDWDLAFAYEALARAHRVAGNVDEQRRNLELARDAATRVADPEDRELLEKDLAELAA
jgi:hypothetical protein